jgi:hypothetical protein
MKGTEVMDRNEMDLYSLALDADYDAHVEAS